MWDRPAGVNETIAEEDACRIEHAISDESFQKLQKYFTKPIGMSKTDETRRGGKKKEKRASGNGRKQAHKDRHSKKPCQTRSIEEDQAVRRRDLGERQE